MDERSVETCFLARLFWKLCISTISSHVLQTTGITYGELESGCLNGGVATLYMIRHLLTLDYL
jgi:hypothetical protein